MKCLKCPEDALSGKALCFKCYQEHEQLQSYQKTAAWLNETLDATRDQLKKKGAPTTGDRAKRWLEWVVVLGSLGAVVAYCFVSIDLSDLPWRYRPPAEPITEARVDTGIPVQVSVMPTIDPESRTVWVGNSPGSVPLLLEAIDLIKRQERRPDQRWIIKLEPGEHRVADSVVVPSFCTVRGSGHLQSSIIGQISGLEFNDPSAAMVVLGQGSGIEHVSIENEGAGNTTVGVSCSATAPINPKAPGDTHNVIRGVSIRTRNPSERSYGIVNNGCDVRLEQVDVHIGRATTTSQALFSTGESGQVSIRESSLVAEDEGGDCLAKTGGGCVGLTVLRGTVSAENSKIRGASQGATVLDGTLQLIKSEATGPLRGVTIIQSGAFFSEGSTVSSISNASNGRVVCKETLKPDSTAYADDCS